MNDLNEPPWMRLDPAKDRARRRKLINGVVTLFLAAMVLFVKDVYLELSYPSKIASYISTVFIALSSFLFVYGAIILLNEYLKGNQSGLKDSIDFENKLIFSKNFRTIFSRIESLEAKLVGSRSEDMGNLADAALEQLKEQLTPNLISELESKFGADSAENKKWYLIARVFDEARTRLLREIDSLGRRGNLNLIVGVLTTVFAIGLLAYLVLWNSQKLDNMPSVLAHYVPRITLVIFVEVFSFFFLRLYRASLLEIRTYQEDLTRLAIQEVAVTSVWSVSNKAERATLSTNLLAATKSLPAKAERASDPAATVELVERLAKVFSKIKGDEKS